ncbi:hypothetical protein ACL6C3_14490 [Capilliphycus salinus ALCB114379]|uniref:hypothetical protein n=1 Tax=Capilliphycus salinus TaxID=2768948 RepID=UPI0039A50722
MRIQPLSPVMLSNRGGVISLCEKPQPNQSKGRRVDRVQYSPKEAEQQGIPVRFLYRDR